MRFGPPVLFLIFDRPEITARVFEAVRHTAAPEIVSRAEGPRCNRPGEDELCRQTRFVTEQIDWKCQVHWLYWKQNLGCGNAVSGAITWFFEQEKEGIILENDCLPNGSFFAFCQTPLGRYRETRELAKQRGSTTSGGSFFHRVWSRSAGWPPQGAVGVANSIERAES